MITGYHTHQEDLVCYLPNFFHIDFRQEVGSLLSVRGENILSWASEDNFLLEDEASGVQEVC